MLKEDDEEDAECLHVQYSPEFLKLMYGVNG